MASYLGRRKFLATLGGAVAAWPLAARAQQAGKVIRIGFVSTLSADSLPQRLEAFRAGLREFGYQEGRNIVIEYRWAEGQYERLPALFAEVVRLNVDVIVTHGTPGALAAKHATNTIPIVMAAIGDAEASGVVASLARPGGNATGFMSFEYSAGNGWNCSSRSHRALRGWRSFAIPPYLGKLFAR